MQIGDAVGRIVRATGAHVKASPVGRDQANKTDAELQVCSIASDRPGHV